MLKRLIFGLFLLIISFTFVNSFDSEQDALSDSESFKAIAYIDNSSNGFFEIFASKTENKSEVIKELDKNYQVDYVANSVDAISLYVTKEEFDELNKRKDIAEIRRTPEFYLNLQDSKQIINSSLTYSLQANSVNLTGAGQTVCIIDSGVNYTHPDLGGCTEQQFLQGNCSKVIGGFAFYNNVSSNKNNVMGDSNHGTHVAGIVAGNGNIRGIAPDTKIVAIKACGPTSSCDGLAVVDGINWCVGNSTAYNISVISMSLGTAAPDLFNYYCDAASPEFSSAINSAVAKNISVVVAAGNGGNSTHISLPACISNATAVGATDKSDSLFYNRASIMSLLAPGVSINSTLFSGGYGELSGTSMATPHIAGAVAIIRQFISLVNITKTPIEITSILNSTGKTVTDLTGINYTRINLYDSLLVIGNNITTYNPVNGYSEISDNASIYFNFTVSSNLNATFSTCSVYVNSTNFVNITILNQSDFQNATASFSPGTYTWRVGCLSNLSNIIYSDLKSFSINTTADTTNPEVTIISPTATTYTSDTLTVNVMTNEAAVCSYSLNEGTTNYSLTANSSNTGFTALTSSLLNAAYTLRAYCNDSSNNFNSTEIVNFTVSVSSTTSSSGSSGGGGGGAKTYSPKLEQLSVGFTQNLKSGERIQFTLIDSNISKHSLTLDRLGADHVNLTLRSTSIELILYIGQDKKVNLTSATFYDLFIRLESIRGDTANITIRNINEEIFQKHPNSSLDRWNLTLMENEETVENGENTRVSVKKVISIIAFLGILTFLVFLIFCKRNKHKHKKK